MDQHEHKCFYLLAGILLVLLGGILALVLTGNIAGRRLLINEDGSNSEDEQKQAALVSELQNLVHLANKTLEDFAMELLAQQDAVRASFCANSSLGEASSQLCEKTCATPAKPRVLMIFPIRGRWNLLKLLLVKLLPLLERPDVCTFIAIFEQTEALAFNKGLLMNAAVIEMTKRVPFDCVIFHDVDMVPVDGDDVYYECPTYPRHLTAKVDKFKYSLPYLSLIGGIIALPLQHFLRVNGFSNMFWGWGAEDDDMYERLSIVGIPVTRPMPNSTRYIMLPHAGSESLDSWRTTVLLKMALKRYRLDGLNSAKYRVLRSTIRPVCALFDDARKGCNLRQKDIHHFLIDPQPTIVPRIKHFFNKH